MSKSGNVSVIIPTYNGIGLVKKNLPSIIKASKNKKNRIEEVIVVDDGSSDDTAKFIRNKKYSKVKVVKHKINRGFSAAVNTGARTAKERYLVLINNDVSVSDDFLEPVLPLFRRDDKLFAASFHEKGYGWAGCKFENGFIVHTPGSEDDKPHETFFVNGGGALYVRDIWMKLGGMDEELLSPFYWEDVDISYRALKRGYRLLWVPGAYVSPNLSATIKKLSQKRVSRIQQRNQLLFIWKNLTSKNLYRKHIRGLFARVAKHPGYFLIVFMAIAKLKPLVKLRKKEIAESKVSDEAIFANFS